VVFSSHSLMRIISSVFTLLLFGLTLAAQQPPAQPSDNNPEAEFQRVALQTINWDRATTPGMKASVELVKKADEQGHPLVQYRVRVTGAPHNQGYTLIAWPIMLPNPAVMMEGLAVAADGTLGCPPNSTASCAQRIKGAELKLTYEPGIGEIYRHALISDDKKSKIYFSIVPFPIVEKDKACSLEVVELKSGFGLVLVRGSGFQPSEHIQFHTESYQDVHNATVTADAQGHFDAPYTPWVKGRTMGVSQVSATGKSCAPKLSFNWGAGQ
jgi:hypothetical protein